MKVIYLSLCFTLLLGACGSSGSTTDEAVSEEISEEVQILNQEVETLEQESQDLDSEVDAFLNEIE